MQKFFCRNSRKPNKKQKLSLNQKQVWQRLGAAKQKFTQRIKTHARKLTQINWWPRHRASQRAAREKKKYRATDAVASLAASQFNSRCRPSGKCLPFCVLSCAVNFFGSALLVLCVETVTEIKVRNFRKLIKSRGFKKNSFSPFIECFKVFFCFLKIFAQ